MSGRKSKKKKSWLSKFMESHPVIKAMTIKKKTGGTFPSMQPMIKR